MSVSERFRERINEIRFNQREAVERDAREHPEDWRPMSAEARAQWLSDARKKYNWEWLERQLEAIVEELGDFNPRDADSRPEEIAEAVAEEILQITAGQFHLAEDVGDPEYEVQANKFVEAAFQHKVLGQYMIYVHSIKPQLAKRFLN